MRRFVWFVLYISLSIIARPQIYAKEPEPDLERINFSGWIKVVDETHLKSFKYFEHKIWETKNIRMKLHPRSVITQGEEITIGRQKPFALSFSYFNSDISSGDAHQLNEVLALGDSRIRDDGTKEIQIVKTVIRTTRVPIRGTITRKPLHSVGAWTSVGGKIIITRTIDTPFNVHDSKNSTIIIELIDFDESTVTIKISTN